MDHRGQILWSVTAICAMFKQENSKGTAIWRTIQWAIVPFGSEIGYHPVSAEGQAEVQLGKKVLSGIFTGCAWYARGIWKGDILVADIEELHNFHASETYIVRLNAKEVLLPKQGDTSAFPCADGSIKLVGKDHEVRTSDQSRGHSEHGEGHRSAHQGEWTIHSAEKQKTQDDLEAWYDFWSILGNFSYHHHVHQGVKFHALPNSAEKLMSSSGPTRHWMFCKKVKLMTSGASMVTASYLGRGPFSRSSENCMKLSKGIHVDQAEIDKHASNIQARTHMARSLVECVEKFAAKRKTACGDREVEARKLRGIDYVDLGDMEFKDTMKNSRKKQEVQMESAMP